MSGSSSAAQPLLDPEADAAADAAFENVGSTAIVLPEGAGGTGRYTEGSVVAQKYRLVKVLGEGGMGAVWVAQNLALGVQVALKLIRTEIEGKVDGLSERLLTEARAAAPPLPVAPSMAVDSMLPNASASAESSSGSGKGRLAALDGRDTESS